MVSDQRFPDDKRGLFFAALSIDKSWLLVMARVRPFRRMRRNVRSNLELLGTLDLHSQLAMG